MPCARCNSYDPRCIFCRVEREAIVVRMYESPYRPSRYQMRQWMPAIADMKKMRSILFDHTLLFVKLPDHIIEVIYFLYEKSMFDKHSISIEFRDFVFSN